MKKKKRWAAILKAFVGLGLMALLIWWSGPKKLFDALKQIPHGSYLFALAVYSIGTAIRTIRWQRLLAAVGEKFPLVRLVQFQFIGAFFNQFLPTSIGGDSARIFYLCRENVSWEKAVGAVLVERIAGMLMLLFMGVAAAAAGYHMYQDKSIIAVLLIFILASVVATLVLFSGRAMQLLISMVEWIKFFDVSAALKRFSKGLRAYRSHPGVLIFVAVVSMTFQFVVIGLFYFFSRQMGMDLHFIQFFIFVPIFLALSLTPISMNGIGVRDWAFALMLTQAGAERAQAGALSMCYWLLTLGAGLIGAIIFVAQGNATVEAVQESSMGE